MATRTAKRPRPRAEGSLKGEPYLTTNTTHTGGRTYRYVVLRYDEVGEDGRRRSRPLVSLGREDHVDPERAQSLADVMRAPSCVATAP